MVQYVFLALWSCVLSFFCGQVRVEGEQKIAELQAVVEELNGKLGTFTQVPKFELYCRSSRHLTTFLLGE